MLQLTLTKVYNTRVERRRQYQDFSAKNVISCIDRVKKNLSYVFFLIPIFPLPPNAHLHSHSLYLPCPNAGEDFIEVALV